MSLLSNAANQATLLQVKAKTDNLPGDPASETGALAKDATVAKEATSSAIKSKTDNLPTTPADETTSTGIKTQTDKLAGPAPVSASTTANWQTAESDVVSIGAAGVKNKVHDLSLNISNLAGTTITVRLYKKVNGVERKVYEQSFNAATDPPGLPIINGAWATHEIIRVSLQSNNGSDNGKAVDYDYILEAM